MPRRDDRAKWAEGANLAAKSEGHKLTYVGAEPFGADIVHRWQLGNGLTVLVLIDRSAPIVAYYTWFRVGSRHESSGKTGLAHLFEHLMFGETETLGAGSFDRKLEECGAETNAATWVDWTFYHELLPADRLKVAIRLEADRMHRLVLKQPQVASEKEVVANERRYRVDDDVEGLASELLYKTAFQRHPYHWPTIGWMQDIEGLSIEDCVAFYRTYYAPNNATLIVAGDVREQSALLAILDAYGGISAQTIPPEDIVPEPPQTEERRVVLRKPSASDKLLVAFKGPAVGDADHVALTVLSEILFGGRASRLYRSLVIERELAIDVRGWVSTFRDPGLFECTVTARESRKAAEILPVLDEAFSRIRADVVSDAELSRAKARLELAALQQLETVAGKAEQVGLFEVLLGEPGHAFLRVHRVRRTTAADVRNAARRFLVDTARTVVSVVPDVEVNGAKAAQ